MGNEVVVLSSPGVASIIMLNEKASQIFKFERVDEEDDDINLRLIAKKINSEVKSLSRNDGVYKNLTRESLFHDTNSTILSLLYLISPKFQNSLPATMIGSIITSIVTFKPTPLQVYLGVLAHEKQLIKHLFDYRVTSSYEEVRRFEISEAVPCDKERTSIKLNAKDGLIQAVADNFDAEIHYLNGLQQTHGLATCLAQATSVRPAETHNEPTIPKLKR